jgi:hypothetical protein
MKKVSVFWSVTVMVLLTILFPVNLFAQNNFPSWLSNLPIAPGEMYGIGHAKLTDNQKAMRLAEERAIVSAVYEAHFFAIERINDYLNREDQNSQLFEEVVVRKQITLSWNTSDVEIIRTEQTSDGTWWCLAIYKKSIDDIINEIDSEL